MSTIFFFAWTGTIANLEALLQYMNSIHESVKFTMEYDTNRQRFLDVLVNRNGNHVTTELYQKTTDVDTTIPRTSAHPPNVFKGVLTGHLTRLKRITSDPTTFEKKSQEVLQSFKANCYKESETKSSLERVRNLSIGEKREAKKVSPLSFLCQYGPHANILKQSLKKALDRNTD